MKPPSQSHSKHAPPLRKPEHVDQLDVLPAADPDDNNENDDADNVKEPDHNDDNGADDADNNDADDADKGDDEPNENDADGNQQPTPTMLQYWRRVVPSGWLLFNDCRPTHRRLATGTRISTVPIKHTGFPQQM